MNEVTVVVAGEALTLLPERAIWWEARRMLLVADPHFGKAASFRALGVFVPRGTTSDALNRLDALVARVQPGRIVFLGDFLHSKRSHAAGTLDTIAQWREENAALELTLVRGNHDDRAGDPPSHLNIRVVDEPLPLGPFALCHHPKPVAGAYVLPGHWHPCISVGGRAFERLRLPCFWFGDLPCFWFGAAVGVLPAFGAFTGLLEVQPQPGDRVFAVADDAVLEVPARGLERAAAGA